MAAQPALAAWGTPIMYRCFVHQAAANPERLPHIHAHLSHSIFTRARPVTAFHLAVTSAYK
jgi:hypothetical protein